MEAKRFKLEYLPKVSLIATVEIPIDLIRSDCFWKTIVEQVLDTPVTNWVGINTALSHDLYMTAKDSNGTKYVIEEKNTLSKRVLEFYKVDGLSSNLKLTQI